MDMDEKEIMCFPSVNNTRSVARQVSIIFI